MPPGPSPLVVATGIALAVDPDGPLIGLAFLGPSGCGKTSTALGLIETCPWRRSRAIADDGLVLWQQSGHVFADAPAPIAGRFEARPGGVFHLSPSGPIRLRLAIDLAPTSTRLIPPGNWQPLGPDGPALPLLHLDRHAPIRMAVRSVLAGHSGRGAVDYASASKV